jgi:phenylacetate 2-hydroxylase
MLIDKQKEAYRTNFPTLPNIPEVPGYEPFIGHLRSLGGRLNVNDGRVYSSWTSQLKSGIVQIRIGDQRSLVISTWAMMKEFMVDNNNSMTDRVHQPGFVDKLGIDISGSPLTDQIRKCRNAALVC